MPRPAHIATYGFVPTILQEAAETATLVALVAAGLGMALVPASVRHLQIPGATYVPLASPRVAVQLALAYREGEVSGDRGLIRIRRRKGRHGAVRTPF